MDFYRRKLPHWQPKGAQYFITFRLADSLPRQAINELRILRRQLQNSTNPFDFNRQSRFHEEVFSKYELALDTGDTGPIWLKHPAIAKVVREAMHYRDSNEYDLFAYCVMSNHVHIVFEHFEKRTVDSLSDSTKKEYPVTVILQELKRYTAYKSNKILGRKGAFWQSESYDRVIRDFEELEDTIAYTLNNPVKAGLVKHWSDWPHTYCKPDFIASFG